MPLAQAPATSFDDQRSGIARSGVNGVERPTAELDGVVRSVNCHGYGELVQRKRQTLAAGLDIRLLSGPTAEKGVRVEMGGDSRQNGDFSRGKEITRDVGIAGLPHNALDIDADRGPARHGDDGKSA